MVCFVNIHPLDSDLSGGKRFSAFKQLGPGVFLVTLPLPIKSCCYYISFFSYQCANKNDDDGLNCI